MEILSQVHAINLKKYAEYRKDILVITADLTESCEAGYFKSTYRERFISSGVSEQNMISIAGGLAREGFIPLVHTFAVFIYRRAYDQIAMSVAYPNLNVKLFGFLPGVMTPGGATHQAIEDISVMRSLPNMTILECGDATDVESVLDLAYRTEGPVYVRMLRGEIPRLFSADEPMKLGVNRELSRGNDLVIVSSGICTEEAMRAVKVLVKKGMSISHWHVSTLKPFSGDDILEAVAGSRLGVVTIENHTTVGGLGSILSEKIAEAGLGKKLHRIGIPDTFLHGASRRYLMKEYGLDSMGLIRSVENIACQNFNISEYDLDEVRLDAVHTDAKAEAL